MPRTFKLNTGAEIPAIGLGTWKSQKGDVGQAVKVALNCGYRHIDCALIYQNEAEIGEIFSEVFKEGKIKREDVFVTSKLWSDSHVPEDVLPACQMTLKNLQLKYLDLYLIHLPFAFKKGVLAPQCLADGVLGYNPEKMSKTWKAMEELVDKGLVKAIGISNFTVKKTARLLEGARIIPSCNQVECHPYLQQNELKKYSEEKGILLVAYSPLGSPDRPRATSEEPVLLKDPVLQRIAQKHGCSTAQVALSWGVAHGIPVLPKSVNEERIKQNLLTPEQVKLDAEDMAAIGAITLRYRYLRQEWFMKPEEVPADHWDGEE